MITEGTVISRVVSITAILIQEFTKITSLAIGMEIRMQEIIVIVAIIIVSIVIVIIIVIIIIVSLRKRLDMRSATKVMVVKETEEKEVEAERKTVASMVIYPKTILNDEYFFY